MRKSALSVVLSFFLLASTASAFIKPQRQRSKSHHTHEGPQKNIGQEVLRAKTYFAKTQIKLKQTNKLISLKRDVLTDKVRLLSGDFGSLEEKETSLKSYEEHARSFIAHNFELFGIKQEDIKLIPKATYLGSDVQFIQFAVFKDKLLIEDASLSFRFKQNKLIQITNHGFSEALPEKKISFSRSDLERTILKSTGAKSLIQNADSFRIEENDKDYRLKRVASYKVIDRDDIELNLQIDHATNKIYELKEEKLYHNGEAKAKLYPRWYDEELTDVPAPYLDIKQDSLSSLVQTDEAGLFETNELTQKIFVDKLQGKFVSITNKTGSSVSAQGVKASDFWSLNLEQPATTSPWLDKITAQYMVYYHVTKILGHALQYIHPSWFDKPLVANTNLSSNCNAHWDGRTINLYSGSGRCANTGLIADVIYHEWGHGLDANTGGIQDGAFSEGIGDIISLLMTRSHLLGVGFMLADRAPVRNLEPDKIYPQDKGSVHAEGLIIGSTFWDLYEAFSKKYNPDTAIDILSQYIFKGVYTARTYLDLYDAILVIDDNDDNLENGSPNTCLVNEVFSKHGLAQTLSWCTLASVESLDLQDENGNGIIEPGETIKLFATAHNPAPTNLEGLTGTISHEDGALHIIEPNLEWDTIAPESSAVNSLAASFMINEDLICGTEVNLDLKLAADTRELLTSTSFIVGKNTGKEELATASDLPKEIRDYTVTRSSIEIKSSDWEGELVIHKALLKFSVDHTYIGDLTVKLVAPSGQKILIFKGKGGAQNISFDKEITDKLKGVTLVQGTWTLEVEDGSFRDFGSLKSFSLSLTPKLFTCEENPEEI